MSTALRRFKGEVDVARIDLEPKVSKHLVEAIYDAIKPELKVEIQRKFRLGGCGTYLRYRAIRSSTNQIPAVLTLII